MAEPVRCASCGRPFNPTFCRCPFCNALVAGAPTPPPAAGATSPAAASRSTAIDYPRLAQEAIVRHRPLLTLEFHPAAVRALDLFIDTTWGEEGLAPTDAGWQPGQGQTTGIVFLGAFLGELVRRQFGGEWRDEPTQPNNPLQARVVLPQGYLVYGPLLVFKRVKNGVVDRLEPVYRTLRDRLGDRGSPAEAAGWVRQSRHFENVPRPELAAGFLEQAVTLTSDPAGRSLLAADLARLRAAAEAQARAEARREEAPRPGNEAPTVVASAASTPGTPIPARRREAPGAAEAPAGAAPPLRRDPAAVPLAEAEESLGRGQGEAALAAFERAVELDPASPRALLGKGQTLLDLGRADQARAWLKEFAGRGECEPKRSILEASAAERTGDVVSAHTLLSRALRSASLAAADRGAVQDRVAALARQPPVLGDAASRVEDMSAAVEAYARINEQHPDWAEAWRERGVGLAILGRVDESLACQRRAQVLEPAVPESYDHEAVTLARLQRLDEALATLERGLERCPGSGVLLARKGVFLAMSGRDEDALRILDTALGEDPAYVETWAFKGDVEQRLGRTAAAITSLERYLAAKPGSTEKRVEVARRQLFTLQNPGRTMDAEGSVRAHEVAVARASAGALAEALPFFDAALAADPRSGELWANRGTCLSRLGRHAEALASFREAEARLGPTHVIAQSQAACCARLDRLPEAVAAYGRALVRDPHDDLARRDMARVLVRIGKADEALPLYQRLVARSPEEAALLRERADALRATRRLEPALAAYDAVLALAPADRDAAAGRAAVLAALGRSPA